MRISGVTYASRRSNKARNIVLTIIILLLILIIAVACISAYNGWILIHPEKKETGAFSNNSYPSYRNISFRGEDNNISLDGWLFQKGKNDKTVIIAHSYGNNRLEFGEKTFEFIKDFLNKGYNVFTFDFRNSGKSGGNLTTFGYYEKNDILAAVGYIKQQGTKHIVLLGFSTGASASIFAAAENKNIDAVIADSPYANLDEYLHGSITNRTKLPDFIFNKPIEIAVEILTGINIDNASPMNSVKNMESGNILLIHGKGDKITPLQASIQLYNEYSEKNKGTAELWETEDAGHATSYLKYPHEYMDKIFTFLDKVYKE